MKRKEPQLFFKRWPIPPLEVLAISISGFLFLPLYEAFGFPQFFILLYNWVLILYLNPFSKQKNILPFVIAFLFQIPFVILLEHSNWIYTFFIVLSYLVYFLCFYFRNLWPLLGTYLLGYFLSTFFAGYTFAFFSFYHILTTGHSKIWRFIEYLGP